MAEEELMPVATEAEEKEEAKCVLHEQKPKPKDKEAEKQRFARDKGRRETFEIGTFYDEYEWTEGKERWEVGEILKEGAMAYIYSAWDRKLEKEVMIKALKPRALEGFSLAQLRAEAKAMAEIDQPGIVRVLDYQEVDLDAFPYPEKERYLLKNRLMDLRLVKKGGEAKYGLPVIIMDKAEGNNWETEIKDRFETGQGFEKGEIIASLRKVAETLEAMRGVGIMHYDLKPANIVGLTNPKIVDFGLNSLAKSLEREPLAWGTPLYMSPEQITGEEIDSGRHYVFVLGTLAYTMLCGKTPAEFLCQSREVGAILYAIYNLKPLALLETMPAESREKFSEEELVKINAVLLKALAKNAKERQRNPVEFVKELIEATRRD